MQGRASSLKNSTSQGGRLAELKKQETLEVRAKFAAICSTELQFLQAQTKQQDKKD